ncbi:MAG: hypothetical protein Gaeavirus36_1 [Gaeavirus sp.]|uniref:Uncharacterized protein n=1 Tax=Gaeavirus sp. TaxID=2487767 RepID=A0A3G4ZZL1_9VIRU|nr:MAG: hypothetical protein Gaeavirus36_1 [Gaeavirus sp.]
MGCLYSNIFITDKILSYKYQIYLSHLKRIPKKIKKFPNIKSIVVHQDFIVDDELICNPNIHEIHFHYNLSIPSEKSTLYNTFADLQNVSYITSMNVSYITSMYDEELADHNLCYKFLFKITNCHDKM